MLNQSAINGYLNGYVYHREHADEKTVTNFTAE